MKLEELTEILRKELPEFKIQNGSLGEALFASLSFPEVTNVYIFRIPAWEDASNSVDIFYLDPSNIDEGSAAWNAHRVMNKQDIIDFIREYYEGWLKLKKYIDSFNLENIVSALTDLGFTWGIFESLGSIEDAYIKGHLEIPPSKGQALTLDIRIPRSDPIGNFYLCQAVIENLHKQHTVYSTSLDKLLDKLTG